MIPLASPDIREADIALCNQVLQSGMLVQGQQVAAFEQAIAQFAGFGECAAVTSGTAALHLALKGLNIGPGDRVLVADFTFTATANVVENLGAECVFIDVDAQRYVLTAEILEAFIRDGHAEGCKALMLVHEFGYPADMARIAELAKNAGMAIVEDAACALGSVVDGQHVGYYGDIACFSFHPRKAITCGEGGAVLSRDPALINRIRVLRNHGITATDKGIDFTEAGLNYRLTDFQAALAIGQLSRFNAELQRRREQVALYLKLLAAQPGITLPQAHEGHSWQSFMIVLDTRHNRAEIIRQMHSAGVQTNLGAQAMHRLDYFRRHYGHAADDFPVASLLYDQGLVLPLYGKLSDAQITQVADTLQQVLNNV